MLENIKGYMKEKGIYLIFLLIFLLVFNNFGYIFDYEFKGFNYDFFGALIVFCCLYIVYFFSLLIVLSYKKLLNNEYIIGKLLITILCGIAYGMGELFLSNIWQKTVLSKSLVNMLIILLPYTVLLFIQILLFGIIKGKVKIEKEVILSFIITVILYALLPDTENVILMVTIYNLIYILLGKKLESLTGKKLLLLLSIFVISLFYLEVLSTKNGVEVIRIQDDNSDINGYEQIGLGYGSGICFTKLEKIFLRKRVCGKAVDGNEEGKWVFWYKTGEKEGEGVYIAGKKEGKWIYWYKNGNKKMEIVYKKDKEIERREWKEEKTIPKDEESIEYFDIGKIKSKGLYRNGYREGKWIEWYKYGGKKSEGNYIAGKKEGKWIYWYEDGNKKAEVSYKNGKEIERKEED